MSAEIASKADGTAGAVYARVPAWHGLGKVTDGLFTAEEALHEAGLDFKVQTAPLFAEIDGDLVVAEGSLMTYRVETVTDSNGDEVERVFPLGVVGESYQPVDPKDLFGFMDEVIGQVDNAHYTAAFGLRGFRQIVCVAETGEIVLDPNGRKDKISQHIVGRTSHDGSISFGMKWANERVECANMLAVHLRSEELEWKTRHTANIHTRMATRAKQAKAALGIYDSYGEAWAVDAGSMIETDVTDSDFDKWLTDIMTTHQKITGQDEIDREATHAIRAIYHFSQTNASIRGTVWGALNAATEYADWCVESKGGKVTTPEEAQFLRQMGDSKSKYGGDFKQLCWDGGRSWVDEIRDTDKKRMSRVAVLA